MIKSKIPRIELNKLDFVTLALSLTFNLKNPFLSFTFFSIKSFLLIYFFNLFPDVGTKVSVPIPINNELVE